jgi:hypothetical protein
MGSSGHPYRAAHAVALLVVIFHAFHLKVPSLVAVPLHPTHSSNVEYDGTNFTVEFKHRPLPAEPERSLQPAQTVPAGHAVDAFCGEHHGKGAVAVEEEEEEEEVMFVAVDTAKKFQMKRSTSL